MSSKIGFPVAEFEVETSESEKASRVKLSGSTAWSSGESICSLDSSLCALGQLTWTPLACRIFLI